jgi:hypothetical protein
MSACETDNIKKKMSYLTVHFQLHSNIGAITALVWSEASLALINFAF